MKKVLLQAHRGVSTDCPENTISAFKAAVKQGYDIIELDPDVTLDDEIVVLHDTLINRTARYPDGREVESDIMIWDITYDKALSYDYGLSFGPEFKGEKIPLLSEAVEFAYDSGIKLKIDNKFELFSEKHQRMIFDIIGKHPSVCGITVNSLDYAKLVVKELPECQVHYDGPVSEEILAELSRIVTNCRPIIWLPLETEETSWVTVGFADKKKADMVKKYGYLGIWIISEQKDYERAKELGADIVETTGSIKPCI